MNSSLETLEDNKVKLSVTIDEAEFDKDIDQAFRKIAREVRLPGFRAGKAPRRVLEARLGVGPAREQALRDAIPTYLRRAVLEHDVDLIDTPEVEITDGAESGPVNFDATCAVRPSIEVIGYGGLRVELPRPEATDDEVEQAIVAERSRHGELVDVERPAANGDFVVLDLHATRDGEPVAGLNADDWTYEVGQGWVADDFDSHLVGAAAGATLEFTTTPKGTTEPVDFAITVSRVQERVLPDLTDEWVAENFGEFESVEAWTQSVRERLDEAKLAQVRNMLVGKVTEALVQLTDVEAPEPLVRSEMQRRVQATLRQLAAQGIDPEQFLSATGRDPQEFVESFRPAATHGVKTDLALRAVAAAEGIEISDDDVEAEFVHLAMHLGQKPKQVRKVYEANDAVVGLKAQLRKSKALDWLLDHVEMVDEAGAPLDRAPLIAGRHHDHDELAGEADDEPTAEHDDSDPQPDHDDIDGEPA